MSKKYIIEHLEPNPHQKARNGNSNTFCSIVTPMRWKGILILSNCSEFEIKEFMLKEYGNDKNYRAIEQI